MDSTQSFYVPLEYVVDGKEESLVCEATWTIADDETRLRVDSEHFPAFWIAGRLVDGILVLDGGRLDESWTGGKCPPHSEFACRSTPYGFEVGFGGVNMLITRPGSSSLIAFGTESQRIRFPSSFGANFALQRR